MMLYTVAIVLVHAVLAAQARNPFQRTRPSDDIDALCAGKPVALFSMPELNGVRYLLEDHPDCPSHIKTAISDLLALIKQTDQNMCAQESIDRLREFYFKYLDTSTEENKQRGELHESLRKFALAYGHDILEANAHRAMDSLVSDKSPVADMLEGLTSPDDVLLPAELAPYIGEAKKQGEDETIYVQSASAPYIRKMQIACRQDFAPLYRPLIKPIVQLVNMGFNYKDALLREDVAYPDISRQLAKWSRLVFLCESLDKIRMVNATGTDGETARILTKEEATALEDKRQSEPPLPEVVELTFAPARLRDQLIFNKADRQLRRAIRAFSTSKSESEKAKKRMMGKGIDLYKAQLKRGNFRVLLSTSYKALVNRIRTGESLRPSDEIVKILDGAIGHESGNLQGVSRAEESHSHSSVDLGAGWEASKVMAREIGASLAANVTGILVTAIVLFCISVVVLEVYLIVAAVGR